MATPPFLVARDRRLRVCARLFGLGTILHELEFALEPGAVGPLGEYMERWSRAVPSTGWPSEIGLALHGATAVLGLLLILVSGGRELDCDDTCAAPSIRQYWPIPIGTRCAPGCAGVLRRWARGGLATP